MLEILPLGCGPALFLCNFLFCLVPVFGSGMGLPVIPLPGQCFLEPAQALFMHPDPARVPGLQELVTVPEDGKILQTHVRRQDFGNGDFFHRPDFIDDGFHPKYRCPKITAKGGTPHCTCTEPCSDAKYGRNVHLVLKDNPRFFNTPPRSSEEWKLEYNARTSAERCNKREKIDYKLENGRYRSSMMWYCRLFAIMMCQHLDAWTLPKTSRLKDLFEQVA